MEKIIQIAIHQHAHTLEESAYNTLSIYLASIEKAFGHNVDGKEIQQDIELRISEHLRKIQSRPICKADIDHIIVLMGTVEELSGDGVSSLPSEDKHTNERRLFRDSDQAILGGVCAGIATYTNIDPTIIRLIFIALTLFGFGIIIPIYIILWVVLPAPTTVSEKLEMRGEPVTLHSITDTIKQRTEELKQCTSSIAHNPNTHTFLARCNGVLQRGGKILMRILIGLSRAVKILLSLSLIFAGVAMLIGSVSFLGAVLSGQYPEGVLMFLAYVNTPILFTVAVFCISLLVAVPGALSILFGFQFLFRPFLRARVWGTLLGIWLTSLLFVIGLGVFFFTHFVAFQQFSPTTFPHVQVHIVPIR